MLVDAVRVCQVQGPSRAMIHRLPGVQFPLDTVQDMHIGSPHLTFMSHELVAHAGIGLLMLRSNPYKQDPKVTATHTA